MQNNYNSYDFEKSRGRIDDILNSSSTFEEKKTIPKRDDLTYTNGYYVWCTSLFVDLRDSSQLPQIHQSRVLAKIYRAYISEIVAIINGVNQCKEINIVGDCVSAIFETPYKADIDNVFSAAAMINSLINTLNYKLKKKGYTEIKAGTGIAYGKVLMIKAGYNGSGINDVVYMGEAVNRASKMCSKASKETSSPLVVTPAFYKELNEHNRNLLTSNSDWSIDYYHGYVYNIAMNDWLKEQQQKDAEKERQKNSWY
ncbi:adenylate/guanylate cyclase domain-containing protein [Peribacillus simplex]|uniref:adenylate/guanylate cyclase domain-containing protein n=1 Tax=Peribacillus simplex TaxID=1478 RepID=UPI000BA7C1B3|nr:adenylate/guanylate cyclase domain-containing protein [Peribacillus simplex]PAL04095.1 adenylate/guanylate cyclase domain-containing protein [Peribacillus simplex]